MLELSAAEEDDVFLKVSNYFFLFCEKFFDLLGILLLKTIVDIAIP